MRYINFLGISFCLLLNIFSLYSSGMKDTIENEKNSLQQLLDAREDNPLKKMETYFDDSGNFTLVKAKELIEQKIKEGEDIVNSQGTSPKRSWNDPLKWLCLNGCELDEPLAEENRLKIAKFFVKNGANNESIKEASLFCLSEINPYLLKANSNIKELLDSIRNQRGIAIDEEEIKSKKEINEGLATMMVDSKGSLSNSFNFSSNRALTKPQ